MQATTGMASDCDSLSGQEDKAGVGVVDRCNLGCMISLSVSWLAPVLLKRFSTLLEQNRTPWFEEGRLTLDVLSR